MMGEPTVMQEPLFYGFRLEDDVPTDHLLRLRDRAISLDQGGPWFSAYEAIAVLERRYEES